MNNKLKRVLPKLNENHTPKGMTKQDGTVCARLRIGHSYLTHCYLLKGEPQRFCVSCNEALTINHLLTNCAEFADSRRKHYSANTLDKVLTWVIMPVNGHRKQQLSYTENQQTLFLFSIFIDTRLTYNSKTRVSSQVFYIPPSCSGDGGPA